MGVENVPPQKPAPSSISRNPCAGYSPGTCRLAAYDPVAGGAGRNWRGHEQPNGGDRRDQPMSLQVVTPPLWTRGKHVRGTGSRGQRGRRRLVSTTSNAEPGTRFNARSCSFDQRGSGAPVMYQSEPLSETIIP